MMASEGDTYAFVGLPLRKTGMLALLRGGCSVEE
jgi:hypothetical protein